LIVRLDDKLHVELFQRVIRYYGANATSLTAAKLPNTAHLERNERWGYCQNC
jgi:hypothetical protein